MAQTETSSVNGGENVHEEEETNVEENIVTGTEDDAAEEQQAEVGDEEGDKESVADSARESPTLPIVIDDLAELGIEWMIGKCEEGIGNWGKQYETSEALENIDDGQLDIEVPAAMPDVKVSSHGQTMHLVPLKEDGRTSTTLTWIRKTALRKDSASDRRLTIRGLSLGDLFHPRIYSLIQVAQSFDFSSTERTMANSASSGILTINFRTILDRVIGLRRYLLDIEIPGHRLEIVCTFPDHRRPPDFETLWKAYEIEGVPPCSSQRPDREILAKQIVVKNLPENCDEEKLRQLFGPMCDEVEFLDDYKNHHCAIVTFVDVITCHVAHARQQEIFFEDGSRPEVYLMTEMVVNSKLMPKRAKDETDEERHVRHTFELLWYHQQRVANAMHMHDRFGPRAGSEYLPRKALQGITRKLPQDIKQRVETRAQDRKAKETAEKEQEKKASDSAVAKERQSPQKGEKEGDDGKITTGQTEPTPIKRQATPSGDESASKRPRRKPFRGASNGGGASLANQRRGMGLAGDYSRRDQFGQYGRGASRGQISPRRGGPPPVASPPSRFGGRGGFMGDVRASPWLVPPSFDRQPMDSPAGYGSPASLLPRREPQSPYEQPGGPSFYGSPAGMPYAAQASAGYVSREMDMHRGGGGGELYQRRDALGPDFQRTDYRGFYGKR